MARYVKSGTVNTVQEINSELEKIATAQVDFLTRDGQSPNAMEEVLDMNSNRIINLPAPTLPSDVLRLSDFETLGTGNTITFDSELKVFETIADMKAASPDIGDTILCKKLKAGASYFSGLLYEVKASGVGEVLANGNIAILINRTKETGTRSIDSLLGQFSNISASPNEVFIEKLRDTLYLEFAVYTPLTSDGLEWHRWLFTNRFNVTNDGAPRMINCSLAYLYVSTQIARTVANNISETRASATTATRASAAGTAVGTWVGPATVLTTTDVLYSSTVGDTLTFSITGVERIELRALFAGNGGIGKVTITESAVEIAEANYLLPADHLVNFISTATGNTTMHIPLAKGLTSGSTYVVEIEVDATNPVGNRIYTAGLLGFDDVAFDATGIHGITLDSTIDGTVSSMSTESGTTAVYTSTDTTKIDWKYIETNVASVATFSVYNAAGTEVATNTLDMYGAGSTVKKFTVAKDLPKGTYYLHVVNGKTKNATSTDYRYFDLGATFYDQTTRGVVGTDDFDNNDVPNNVQDPNNGTDFMLIGSGNIEVAIGVRKTTEGVGDQEFLGGIHGFETTPVPVFTLDGSVIDFAGGVTGDTWAGKDLGITYTTTLKFFIDSTDFCTVDYDLNLSQAGYRVKTTKTTLAESIIHDDYSIMLNSPSTDALNQGLSVGGGFENVAADANYTLNAYDNSGTFIPPLQGSVGFVNLDYSVLAYYNTVPVVPDLFNNAEYNDGPYWALLQDRTDRTLKFYTRAFNCDDTNGVTVPSGTSWTHGKVFRALKGNTKALVGL